MADEQHHPRRREQREQARMQRSRYDPCCRDEQGDAERAYTQALDDAPDHQHRHRPRQSRQQQSQGKQRDAAAHRTQRSVTIAILTRPHHCHHRTGQRAGERQGIQR